MVSSFITDLTSSGALLITETACGWTLKKFKDKITLEKNLQKIQITPEKIFESIASIKDYRLYLPPPSNRRRNGRSKLQRNPSTEPD